MNKYFNTHNNFGSNNYVPEFIDKLMKHNDNAQ